MNDLSHHLKEKAIFSKKKSFMFAQEKKLIFMATT